MRVRTIRLFATFMCLLFGATLLFALLPRETVSANGEQYTWTSKDTITAKDGSYGNKTYQLKASPSGSRTFRVDNVPLTLKCKADITLVLDSQSNTSAEIKAVYKQDVTSPDPNCRVGSALYNFDSPVNVPDPDNKSGTRTGTGSDTGLAGGSSEEIDADSDVCPIEETSALRWIICPLVDILDNTIGSMQGFVMKFLFTPVDPLFNGIQKSANNFRNVGLSLLAIAALFMIVSSAFGFELFDAYTIKKILPRILIAAIGIALALPLLQFVVTLTNDLGVFVGNIIIGSVETPNVPSGDNAPFGQQFADFFAGASVGIVEGVGLGVLVFGIAGFSGPGLIALAGTVILALLIGLLVLAIRQAVIMVCVLFAPIAIAAYILPGTQKIWGFWKNSLITSLVMFPLIMALIASGAAMSNLLGGIAETNESMALMAVIVRYAPYFMLPFAFKLAGGLMSTIFSIANDRGRGLFDRSRNYRAQERGKYLERKGRRVQQKQADIVRSLQKGASSTNNTAFGRFARRAAARGLGGYNLEAGMSAKTASVGKEIGDIIATGDDAAIRGLSVDLQRVKSMNEEDAKTAGLFRVQNGQRQYKSLGGAWVDEASVLEGHRRWGKDTFAQQAALSYEMRKATSDEQVQGLAQRYSSLATGQWGMSETQAGGAWIGGAFENQNQHLEYKSTDWKTGDLRASQQIVGADGKAVQGTGILGAGLVDEVYDKRGSYNMAQMGANTIEQLKESYKSADLVLAGRDQNGNAVTYLPEQIDAARDHKEKIEAIAETFMHDYGQQVGSTTEGETPITGAPSGRRQANTPGSAHTAERVVELAQMTGIYDASPRGNYSNPQDRADPHGREQG